MQNEIADIPLKECRNWIIESETGNIKHDSGEFFYPWSEG